ncbi:MAG: hypothetical protein ACI9TF_001814, partial [Paracrocinitomix sp.]
SFGTRLLGDHVLLRGQSFAEFGVVNVVLGHRSRVGAPAATVTSWGPLLCIWSDLVSGEEQATVVSSHLVAVAAVEVIP